MKNRPPNPPENTPPEERNKKGPDSQNSVAPGKNEDRAHTGNAQNTNSIARLPSPSAKVGGCILTPPNPIGEQTDKRIIPAIIRPGLAVLHEGRFWQVLRADHQTGTAVIGDEYDWNKTVDFHRLKAPLQNGIRDMMADDVADYRSHVYRSNNYNHTSSTLRGNLLSILAITDHITDFALSQIIYEKLQELAALKAKALPAAKPAEETSDIPTHCVRPLDVEKFSRMAVEMECMLYAAMIPNETEPPADGTDYSDQIALAVDGGVVPRLWSLTASNRLTDALELVKKQADYARDYALTTMTNAKLAGEKAGAA